MTGLAGLATMAAPTASQLAVNGLSAQSLLSAFGLSHVGVVLFAETGLLVGFSLPGDSLLCTAGLLCTGMGPGGLRLSLVPLLLVALANALAGSQCGYVIGRKAGGALLARSRSARLHQKARRAEELLERFGYAKAIVLARFVPVVRTVLNPIAGPLRVPIRTFTVWQVVSGLVWSLGLILAGHALGSSVPNVDQYLLPMVAVIVALSLVPLAAELYRSRRAQSKGARG